jgi:tyrosine-protein kinase Etk/Wzc
MRKGGSQNLVLASHKPDELAIESLRNLRTALHFAALGSKNNILMLSGPAPGIGKSFISVNLGTVIAATGASVLLIDADMRRGHLHQYLGRAREPGLSDLISGTAEVGQAIRKTATPGLDLLPTGAIPPNPSELLLHERFATLLDALSKQYDQVIIDSPPVLAVTDAAIIGRLSGMSLMVVKAGAHPLREVEQATKRLKQAGVNLRGLLFNDVKKTNSRYGSRYTYQYAYKSD